LLFDVKNLHYKRFLNFEVIVSKDMFVEISLVVIRSLWHITTSFIDTLFFFWPRKYKDISSDVVLITGGGKGIGRLIAVEFAKRKPRQVTFNIICVYVHFVAEAVRPTDRMNFESA